MHLNEYQQRVTANNQHTWSNNPCSRCGDLDGCHKPGRLRRALLNAIENGFAEQLLSMTAQQIQTDIGTYSQEFEGDESPELLHAIEEWLQKFRERSQQITGQRIDLRMIDLITPDQDWD